jgi:alpha-1,2-mannosyltransferase
MTERHARLIAFGVAVLGILVLFGAAAYSDVQPDADAYWLAAERLRHGLPLYGGSGADETEIYRYSPWLAVAWVPLTFLGQDAAYLVWRAILVAATLAAVWPLVRRPSVAALTLAVLLGGILLTNLQAANVTPLMIGMLAAGLRTRAGPLILGVVASLKLFPIIFIAGYLAERRWRAAGVAVSVTAALWLSVLAFDAGRYAEMGSASFYVGGVSLFAVSPLIWLPVAASLAIVLVRLVVARSRWTWLAAAAVIPLAVPRVWLPDAGYLLVGMRGLDDPQDRHPR